jgi:hypothetical protein
VGNDEPVSDVDFEAHGAIRVRAVTYI